MDKLVKEGLVFSLALLVLINLGEITQFIMAMGKDNFYVMIGNPMPFWLYTSGDNPRAVNLLYLAIDLAVPVILGFGISYVKNRVMKK